MDKEGGKSGEVSGDGPVVGPRPEGVVTVDGVIFPSDHTTRDLAFGVNSSPDVVTAANVPALAVEPAVLLQASEAARLRTQAQLQLVMGVGHDVKNLLAGPLGLLQIMMEELKNGGSPDKSQLLVDLESIHTELLRAAAITNRVMDADGNLRINKESLELHALIDAVVKYCRSLFASDGIKINFNQIDQLVMDADMANFFSALLNIIKNAGEALRENLGTNLNPTIDVSFSTINLYHGHPTEFLGNGRHVKIEVVDNGSGIPRKIRETIFEGVSTKGNGGHGIGLPMVRLIVRAHGGDVLLDTLTARDIADDESLAGRSPGTKFTVVLPIKGKKR